MPNKEDLMIYLRILTGVVLLALFAWGVLRVDSDPVLLDRLWMILLGILEAGSGVALYRVNRAARKGKK